MGVDARLLEKPLPKPGRDLVGYAAARVLEALLEALLALEKERLLGMLASREERKWFERRGVPRVPTSRLKRLSQLLEAAGYRGVSQATSMALDLHDYQYHGPDPAAELSRYTSREEAARDTLLLIEVLVELVETRVKPRLVEAGAWREEHEEALRLVKAGVGAAGRA